MKKIGLLALLLILPMLFACGEVEKEESEEMLTDGFKMEAEVTALDEKIEVEVIKSEYASGTFLIITSDNTSFFDKNGAKISKADLKVGDTVEIVYNGQMMMSLPPQVVALQIKKI